jgi:DDE superfamily endonuclease
MLLAFAPAMTEPTFQHTVTLAVGALLTPGRRTVASALRAVGLGSTRHFTTYHRVFNRARWSALQLSRRLLLLLIDTLLPAGAPIRIVVDDTLERRAGPKIPYKGLFRDPVRSTAHHKVFSWGIRWLCLCLLVPLPWSKRQWALPFLAVPLLAAHTAKERGKPQTTRLPWTQRLVRQVYRWCREAAPEREVRFVGDGDFAAVALVHTVQQLSGGARAAAPHPVHLVARLRLDARLYDDPEPPPKGKRGRKPKKGARQPRLDERLCDPDTAWEPLQVAWYGGGLRTVEVATGRALWHTPGQDPVPIRWVLVREPQPQPAAASAPEAAPATSEALRPGAYFCSDPTRPAAEILGSFVSRWNIEVTFQELRAHLGLETAAHWSAKAVGRTTPCLLGLFSVAVLQAHAWFPQGLSCQRTGWYAKEQATFSDVLAAVRARLWQTPEQKPANYAGSALPPEWCLIPQALLRQLHQVACYAH